jgi:hypothetical protein
MSVTPIALTRRRALAAGFAGAAAFMTLATRAGSRDSEWAARLDQTIDGAVADRKIGATVVKVVRSGNSRAKLPWRAATASRGMLLIVRPDLRSSTSIFWAPAGASDSPATPRASCRGLNVVQIPSVAFARCGFAGD